LGHTKAGVLVLPRPEKRTVRLVDANGRPYAKARGQAALFGADNNHCGAAVGFPLGEFVSDARGEFTLTAPRSPLAISLPYFVEEQGGPAGTAYAARNDSLTGAETAALLKRVWTLAEREYSVTVRQAGSPLKGLRLTGCLWNPLCGADCGPLGAESATDAAGVVRFREQDLRRLRNVSLTDSAGRSMYLSQAEMRDLLTSGRVSVEWRETPRPPQIPPREP